MRLTKYGNKKCMIENENGSYTFLNVSITEALRFWLSSVIKKSIRRDNGEKKSSRS